MSLQETLDRFKEIQVTGKEFRAGMIGWVAGLLLGLLIGWVLWPVEWQTSDASVTGSPTPAIAATPTVAPTPVPADTPQASEGNIWTSLLLALLSIAAVGGGAYLVWRYYLADRLRRMRAESESSLRTPQAASGAGETIDAYAAPQRSGAAVYRTAQAEATRVAPVQPPTVDVTPFDEDEIAAPVSPPPASSSSASPSSASPSPRTQPGATSFAPSVAVSASTAVNTPDAFADDDGAWAEEVSPPPSAQPLAAQTPAGAPQRSGGSPGWVAGASRLERYQTIDHFHAEFTAGMTNFDWMQPIRGAQDGVYAGEYGAGVSERHGMLNNDPEQVVAIEVYIFDKSDEKHLVNVSRVVLSEYADTNLRKHFEREKDRLGPIVAQPNTTLQLETRQFVLLCTITEVVYSDEGIFKRVAMDMELKKRV